MSPIINLGFISIHWYSIMLFLAILFGSNVAIGEAKKHGFSEDFMVNMLFLAIVLGIVGARVYYVIFNFDYYLTNPLEIFEIWNGGLAIHGGILFGLTSVYVYLHKKNVSFVKILDYVVVGFILAQAIGRWGNFFNGEAHGEVCSLAFLKSLHLPSFIVNGMYIDGNYYVPTFLFESIWCLIGFVIMIIFRRKKFIKVGYLSSFYLIWYGFERFFVEGMRTDSLMFFSLRIAQIVSLFMMLCGIILFIYSYKKKIEYGDDFNE